MKKILSKVTVKRSTSKGKSKLGSPVLDTLPPAGFHFTEVPTEASLISKLVSFCLKKVRTSVVPQRILIHLPDLDCGMAMQVN